MVFDGDCNFCRFWIQRWQQATPGCVDYIPFQDPSIPQRFPELPRERFEKAVHLIEPNGTVASGAEAVARSLAHGGKTVWLWAYHSVPGAAALAETAYGFVAGHRVGFSFLTRLFWGRDAEVPSYQLVSWIFLRSLGLISLIAFISLWIQVQGLLGGQGVLPAAQYIEGARHYFDQQRVGARRFYLLPTWFWFGAGDGSLNLVCGLGTALSVLLIIGVAPRLCAFLIWTLYLSLCVVGRDFLSFQWDVLLLETLLMAVFLAPGRLFPGGWREGARVGRLGYWLLKWLLFRLMFESGCVKLLSGDASWRQWTALDFHYETQPLPTWIGWFAHQAPERFQKASVAVMFAIELILPFFIFGPRRLRLSAAAGLGFLQVWILLTGNYGFFNYLTLALVLLLLDDAAVRRFLPGRLTRPASAAKDGCRAGEIPPPPPHHGAATHGSDRHASPGRLRWLAGPAAAAIVLVSIGQLAAMFHSGAFWLWPARRLGEYVAPFRTINTYGLFAVMTTSRPEIIVEGSNDLETWRAYGFKYKPGPLERRPAFVAPHQPRLDWQMWFAALGSYRQNPWLVQCCVRLLQGSPEVIALLESNPFPEKPPRYIRAVAYDYHFTNRAQRRRTGEWWRRELQGDYLPVISLRDSGAVQ
jgi:predicted DCC family thiol-disulfide oxidoreductase YuxK